MTGMTQVRREPPVGSVDVGRDLIGMKSGRICGDLSSCIHRLLMQSKANVQSRVDMHNEQAERAGRVANVLKLSAWVAPWTPHDRACKNPRFITLTSSFLV